MGWGSIDSTGNFSRPPTPPMEGPGPASPQGGTPNLQDGYAGKPIRLYGQKILPSGYDFPKANMWSKIIKPLAADCAAVARRLLAGAASARWLVAGKASPFVAGLVTFIWGPAVSISASNEPGLDYHPQGTKLTEDEYNAIMAQIASSPGDNALWNMGWYDRYIVDIILTRYNAGVKVPAPDWLPIIRTESTRHELPGIKGDAQVFPGKGIGWVADPNPFSEPLYAPGPPGDAIGDQSISPHNIAFVPGQENERAFVSAKGNGRKDGDIVENGRVIPFPKRSTDPATAEEETGPNEADQGLQETKMRFLQAAIKKLTVISEIVSHYDVDELLEEMDFHSLYELFYILDVLEGVENELKRKHTGYIDGELNIIRDDLDKKIDLIIELYNGNPEILRRKLEEYIAREHKEAEEHKERDSAIGKVLQKLERLDPLFKDRQKRDEIEFVMDRLRERGFDTYPLEETVAPYDRALKFKLLEEWLKSGPSGIRDNEPSYKEGHWWLPSTSNIRNIAKELEGRSDLTEQERGLVKEVQRIATELHLKEAIDFIDLCSNIISSEGDDKSMEKLDPPFLNELFRIIKDLERLYRESDHHKDGVLYVYNDLNDLVGIILFQPGAPEILLRNFTEYAKGGKMSVIETALGHLRGRGFDTEPIEEAIASLKK